MTVSKFHRPRFPGSILVAVRTGGVSKTLASQILQHFVSDTLGYQLDLFSLDVAEDDASSKLKKFLPETRDIRFAPSMSQLMSDPSLSIAHFEQVAEILARPGSLVDFGANVAPAFFSWSEHSGITPSYGQLQPITLVVPVVAQSQSVGDAIAMIAQAIRFVRFLPVRRIVIVYNERDGEFSGRIPGYAKLKIAERARVAGIRISSIVLPLLESDIWNAVQMFDMSFAEILGSSREELKVRLDLPIIECGRGRNIFRNWLQKAVEDFNKVDIFP